MKFKFLKKIFNRFTSSKLSYYSIKNTFKYHLHRHFLPENKYLSLYEDQIVTLSVFLFISASFMKKTTRDGYFDLDWESYFTLFKPNQMQNFLLCSISYLLDSGRIFENMIEIEKTLKGIKEGSVGQYLDFFISHNKNGVLNENIDLNKYMKSLELVLKIHDIYHKEIPNDSSKVVDLVDYTIKWKLEIFDLFQHKAEYVMFTFFLNLRK